MHRRRSSGAGPRARIRAAFRDSLAGETRLVLVSGEFGIGKTALLIEAAAGGDQDVRSFPYAAGERHLGTSRFSLLVHYGGAP